MVSHLAMFGGYMGIMGKKTEITIQGLGFRIIGFKVMGFRDIGLWG